MPNEPVFGYIGGVTALKSPEKSPKTEPNGPLHPVVLSISGFDPSSGAGLTADIKTIAAHGCYGVGCLTAVTIQNTRGVSRVEHMAPAGVRETLESLVADLEISAVRIGMLGSEAVAMEVGRFLGKIRPTSAVLDPVLKSSSGHELLDPTGLIFLRDRLLSSATVITPNLDEAAALTGLPVRTLGEMAQAGRRLLEMGANNVIITGGHLAENTDVIVLQSGEVHHCVGPKVDSRATHGTGCAFATALACNLALNVDLILAAGKAKVFVTAAIKNAYPIGQGKGPINHLYRLP